ncbi:MAG: helix-turn-helix domain-containing protein [Thermoguttaceae bacterium]
MTTKQKTPSPQFLRRKLGGELLQKGYDIDEVTEITGASVDSVKRWADKIDTGGLEALQRKPQSGRPAKLSQEQLDTLYGVIVKGAVASGFTNDRWESKRIRLVIQKLFNVTYHKNYIWEIMRKIGLTPQLPTTRSKKRSQKAIDHWRRYVWPGLKKG